MCASNTFWLHEPIGERFLTAPHWAAAIGLINLIHDLARYELIGRLNLWPLAAD